MTIVFVNKRCEKGRAWLIRSAHVGGLSKMIRHHYKKKSNRYHVVTSKFVNLFNNKSDSCLLSVYQLYLTSHSLDEVMGSHAFVPFQKRSFCLVTNEEINTRTKCLRTHCCERPFTHNALTYGRAEKTDCYVCK